MTAPGSSPDQGTPSFRFGDFELHLAGRELLRSGVAVELQPKVFDFIAYLLLHRERAVGKEELLESVWPGQVVTDSALTRCARRAREALDDSAEHPWAIHTLHARGYRFIAAVEEVAAPTTSAHAPAAADDAGEPVPPPARPSRASRWWLTAPALLLAAIALWWALQQPAPMPAEGGIARIAVLPVENATGEERYDWARLGLMGSISEILRREAKVRVLNPRDVLALAERAPPGEAFEALRRRHGITHVVEGRIERVPGQLRLLYTLSERGGARRERTVTGSNVADLAHAAGADLRVLLGYAGGAISADSFVTEAYQRGLAVRLQGDVEGALKYFRLAAEQAPDSFWPRYEIAIGLRDLGRLDEAGAALEALREEAAGSGDREAQREAHNALGVLYWRAGNLGLAAERLGEALRVAEEIGDAEQMISVLVNLGILNTYRGEHATARRHLTRALELEASTGIERSTGAIANSLGQLDLREGHHDSAERHLQTALDQFRLIGEQRIEAIVTNGLGELRCTQGRYAEAYDLYSRALPVHRRLRNRVSEAAALSGLSCAEAGRGRLRQAIEHAEAALALAQQSGNRQNAALAQGLLGEHHRRLGEFEAARRWTDTALAAYEASGDLVRAHEERLQLVRLAMAQAQWEEAARGAEAIHAAATAHDYRPQLAEALHLLARIALATGDRNRAAERLDQAQAEAGRMSNGKLLGELALTRAELALAVNDPVAARTALAEAEERIGVSARRSRLQAALAAAEGDPAAALAFEEAARAAAGEAWRPDDEARLQARTRAARR